MHNQLRVLCEQFQERTACTLSQDTVRRWLEEKGWRWKRCRRSLKEKRDETAFLEGKRILTAFHEHEAAGDLDVFYLDESGFSSRSCVPTPGNPRANLAPTRQCVGPDKCHRFLEPEQ